MSAFIYRAATGRFQSTSHTGWFKADGSNGGTLPPPTGRNIKTAGYGEVIRGNVPLRVLEANRLMADTSALVGPNGTQQSVTLKSGAGNFIPTAPAYYDMLPGERCYAGYSGRNDLTFTVTDSEGATRDYVQPVCISTRVVDAFGDTKVTGKGEWQYITASAGQVKALQIVLVLPADSGRARIEWVQTSGKTASLSQSTWTYENTAASTLKAYMNADVTIPAGLVDGEKVGFRARVTYLDRPTWPVQWSSYYYFKVIANPAPASAQTFPTNPFPTTHWSRTPAYRIPYTSATATTKQLPVAGSTQSVPIAAEADQLTEFRRQLTAYNGGVAMTTREFAGAIYIVDSNTPTYRVRFQDFFNLGFPITGDDVRVKARWDTVPVPAGATPALGTDGHIAMYNPATDQWWEFWQWHEDEEGRFWAAQGGRTDGISQGNGQNDGYSVSASGLAMLPTVLKVAEVKAALAAYNKTDQSAWDDKIGHVLSIGIPGNRSGIVCWPAKSTDGNNSATTAPIEGQRASINQSIDLTAINWRTPGEHIICRALQKYGMMFVDTGGSIAMACQSAYAWQLATGEDPYVTMFGNNAPPWQWNMTELIPQTAWRFHQVFSGPTEFTNSLLPA